MLAALCDCTQAQRCFELNADISMQNTHNYNVTMLMFIMFTIVVI